MRTATKQTEVYTAKELQEHFPQAFERAHQKHCESVGQDSFNAECEIDNAKDTAASWE